MKRSCVIIPPPPPKPTTPSKQIYGTKPANEDFQGNTFNINDTQHYFMRVFSSNCLYWDENSENWINRGCKASVQQRVLIVLNAVVVVVVDLDDEDDDDDDDGGWHYCCCCCCICFSGVTDVVFARQDICYVI